MLGSKVDFGQVKSIEAKKKTRSLALDLYRLLHFAKDVMGQEGGPSQILLCQAIGRKITFYMYTLVGRSTIRQISRQAKHPLLNVDFHFI